MKISIFAIPELSPGKQSIKDNRLDQVDSITKSKKKTYVQVELVAEDGAVDADAILALKDSLADLILRDLDFVESRLAKEIQDSEKVLLNKLKSVLEKEEIVFKAGLSQEEKVGISGYGLFTNKPIIAAEVKDLEDKNSLLARTIAEAGFISFFTTGEKETRAWLIKKGTTAWVAAGAIHSDIQQGFIRAEIISLDDFIFCNGETGAKQAGKLRLEQKEYVMQDADLTNFRFNK